MKMMQKSLLALAVLATTAMNVQAASSVDLKVIGSIDPGTCTPTLSGGGIIDYGTMSPSALKATGYTVLAAKQVDLDISCTAPSKVGIKVFNGRPGTTPLGNDLGLAFGIDSSVTIFGLTGSVGFAGLGKVGNASVGGYGIRMIPTSVTADAKAINGLTTNDGGSSWSAWSASSIGNMSQIASGNRFISFAANGSTTPLSFENLTSKIEVQAFINARSELDLKNIVKLDGLSTLELLYLP